MTGVVATVSVPIPDTTMEQSAGAEGHGMEEVLFIFICAKVNDSMREHENTIHTMVSPDISCDCYAPHTPKIYEFHWSTNLKPGDCKHSNSFDPLREAAAVVMICELKCAVLYRRLVTIVFVTEFLAFHGRAVCDLRAYHGHWSVWLSRDAFRAYHNQSVLVLSSRIDRLTSRCRELNENET